MRNAEEFVADYLNRGYSLDRVRVIAATKSDALRAEILRILDEHEASGKYASAALEAADDESKEDGRQEEAEATMSAAKDAGRSPEQELRELAQAMEGPREEAEQTAEAPAPGEEHLEGQIRALESELAAANEEKAELAMRANALESRVARLADLEKRLADADAEIGKVRERLAAQEEALADFDALKESAEAKEREASELREQLTAHEQLLGDYAAVKEMTEAKEREAEKLRQKLAMHDQLVEDYTQLKRGVEEKEREAGWLRNRLADQEKFLGEYEAIQKKAESLAGEAGDLRRQLAEHDELLKEHEALQQQAEEGNRQLELLRQQLAEHEALVKEHEAAQVAAAENGRAMEGLREQLDKNEEVLSDLQRSIEAKEDDLQGLRQSFEKESLDLRKRAEQEVRLVRRRMILYQRVAAGTAAAAGILLCAVITMNLFGGRYHNELGESRQPTLNVKEKVANPADAVPAAAGARGNVQAGDAGVPSWLQGGGSEAAKVPPKAADEIRTLQGGAQKPVVDQGPVAPEAYEVAPAAEPEFIEYKVLPGDNYTKICKKILNDSRWATVQKVVELNRKTVSDPRGLRPGQVIKLPNPRYPGK